MKANQSQTPAQHAEYYTDDKSRILFSDLFVRSSFVHSAKQSEGNSNCRELPQLSFSDHHTSAAHFPAGCSQWENLISAGYYCSSQGSSSNRMLLSKTVMIQQRNVPPIEGQDVTSPESAASVDLLHILPQCLFFLPVLILQHIVVLCYKNNLHNQAETHFEAHLQQHPNAML